MDLKIQDCGRVDVGWNSYGLQFWVNLLYLIDNTSGWSHNYVYLNILTDIGTLTIVARMILLNIKVYTTFDIVFLYFVL